MSAPLQGATVGVFGSDPSARAAFEASVAKRSEAEGIIVYHRTEGGRRYSLLDTADFPDRIQGSSRIASLSDHAFYMFPKGGRLSPPDGELAVLLEAFGVPGTLELLDGSPTPEMAVGALRGTSAAGYRVEERSSSSSSLDLSGVVPRKDLSSSATLVYIDRAFSVRGVGTVALGFILSGSVSVHDQLRPVPGATDLRADVRGIQINDQDFESAGRGIRVGLSLKGVEPMDLEKCHWLDDGSLSTSSRLSMEFVKSAFYRQEVGGRDLHLQLPGELVPARVEDAPGGGLAVTLPVEAPIWNGMRSALIDLNGKLLRVAGGCTCKL